MKLGFSYKYAHAVVDFYGLNFCSSSIICKNRENFRAYGKFLHTYMMDNYTQLLYVWFQ